MAVTVNGASATGNNTAASDDVTPFCGTSTPNQGMWYVVTGTGNTMTASTCLPGTDFDTKIQVFCDCDPTLCVGGNDDAAGAPAACALGGLNRKSIVEWCSDVGQTYYIIVGGFGSSTGNFELTVTDSGACADPPLCTPPPPPPACTGDTCAAPLAIGSVPFNDTGNTANCTDDYDEICDFNTPGSPDKVYAYTPIADECVDITLCNGSAYDTKLYVYAGSCGAYQSGVFHACNDDACPGFVSELLGVNLTGGTTYYIVIDGWGGEFGDYVLDITPCAGPCDVVCDAAKTPENEPNCGLPTDTVNGGCNSDPVNPPTSIIACGQEYCGTAAFDGATRDTDWYEVTVAGSTRFTWTVTAEFDSLIGLVETIPPGSPNCADSTGFLSPFGLAAPCEVSAVVTDCLPAGTYRFFAAPDFAALVTCGAEYNARLDCEVCTIPVGACCPGDGSCVPDQTESACVGSGGSWLGDGSTCTPNLCPQPPSNDLCDNAIAVAVPSTTAGSTDAATIDSAFPTCGTSITSPGVWYSVTGTGNTMTASLCNGVALYDTKLSVYCPDCATATCVVGIDDSCGLQSEVSWCSQAGQTYLILVHGFGGQSGPFELVMSDNGVGCADPPPCAICGEPGAGDCCVANGSVGCDDLACCELVCACDSFCCDTDWDENCAGPNAFVPGCSALDLCAVCQPTGACCVGLTCTIETEIVCLSLTGTYLGDGTDCSGQGGGNPSLYAADPNVAIPDGDTVTGVSHTINVPVSFVVGDVDVDVVITHTGPATCGSTWNISARRPPSSTSRVTDPIPLVSRLAAPKTIMTSFWTMKAPVVPLRLSARPISVRRRTIRRTTR